MREHVVTCEGCNARTVLNAHGQCSFCGSRQGKQRAKLTPDEIATYYDIHKRGRSLWSLAQAIWKRYGYSSAGSARTSLEGHFEREEFRRGERPPKPRKKRGVPRRLTDEQVAKAYRRYTEEGLSARAVAHDIWQEAGYSSPGSCETALGKAFHEAGFEVRGRIEATRIASTKHGLAPKHGPRPGYGTYTRKVLHGKEDAPRCKGTISTYPGKGNRCARPAANGSEFCASHDPKKQAKRQAHLARLHEETRRRIAEGSVPMAPFAAFLRRCIAEEGSNRAAAERLGLNNTAIARYARGLGNDRRPKETIQRKTVEKVLERDDRDIAELYPEFAPVAAAA
jgi:hypothetical protein